MIYAKAADEFASIVQPIIDEGKIFCPYWPMMIVRATDANNFQPMIGFKSRFGILDPNQI